jgi:hypothetical protein
MRYKLNGQFISIDCAYTSPDGTKYANLRSADVRQQLGVVEVSDAERKDERFYMHTENEDGSFTITPKDMEDGEPYTDLRGVERRPLGLRSFWIVQVKDIAGKMLAQTDWMVIRKAERGVDIPESVAATRAAIIAEADRLETAIAGCADVETLIAVVGSQDWPNDRV